MRVFLNKISKLPNLEYILIETRSDKDDLFGVGKKLARMSLSQITIVDLLIKLF